MWFLDICLMIVIPLVTKLSFVLSKMVQLFDIRQLFYTMTISHFWWCLTMLAAIYWPKGSRWFKERNNAAPQTYKEIPLVIDVYVRFASWMLLCIDQIFGVLSVLYIVFSKITWSYVPDFTVCLGHDRVQTIIFSPRNEGIWVHHWIGTKGRYLSNSRTGVPAFSTLLLIVDYCCASCSL